MEKPEELRVPETPEEKAAEELSDFGLQAIPENIKVVLALQATRQHPEGFQKTAASDSLDEVKRTMEENEIKRFVHAEGPYLWTHCRAALKAVDFLDIPADKKEDLKLIMLYHDFGKTSEELYKRKTVGEVQKKELKRGKLYRVAMGHASEKLPEIKAGFKANGILGRKLDIFMLVVENHMETSLPDMSGPKLVKLFEKFGKTDEERKEVAELLMLAVKADSRATLNIDLKENGEISPVMKNNWTGLDFDKIWQRYQEARKGL